MKTEHNRAFKEWAISCEAMREGKQILLIRKGGIREDGGTFEINDPEFFLMPTFEHQNAELLQSVYIPRLEELRAVPFDPRHVTLTAYAVVDTILTADTEAQVNAVADEFIWNPAYVQQRFDFNPYDPLYLVILRVYRLPESITLPLIPEYIGCRSWVTLEKPLSTQGAVPALSDAEFTARRESLLARLNHPLR